MARWIAVAVGVMAVGLLVSGFPWRAGAQDADRIAALETRVANLERTLLLGAYDLSCAEGEIVGELTVEERQPAWYRATITWKPGAAAVNPLQGGRGAGSATFRDCT